NNADCTMICTPPSTHVELAKLALKKGSHVFIEKPLSNSLLGLNDVLKLSKNNSLHVFVGYVFRFDLGLRKVKELLKKNAIGNILSFDAYEGWYLPKWRPWQDYTKSYTASEKLGGGIVLDGSHELNYLQWLGGKVDQVFSYYSKIPKLKTKTEGLAEILLSFRSKAIGRIHLDYVNPKYNRHCEIIGDKGSIRWYFENKTIEIQKSNQTNYKKIKYGKDNNEMYLSELKYVINCLKGKKNDLITISDAKSTLEVSLAIKKSGKINRPVLI
ncbi:MAG: Gfo/Idh/MocA family oxidoreductase, partial [Patescibacteria group bacterium]|nr:Gfo/Idh/MocA family oxidoreductase [Patescibacteria group bacterium]